MRFNFIEIQNFLSIEKDRVNLYDRGLILVEGKNLDDPSANSNGAGKSSIADALCWCLFGITARDVSGDGVINRQARKDTHVTIEIEDGSDIYRVSRGRKSSRYKNQLVILNTKTKEDLTQGSVKKTQEILENILGCSKDVFLATICHGQEQMPNLPSMTDKTLKAYVEEAAGIDRLTQCYDTALKNKRSAEKSEAAVADELAEARRARSVLEASVGGAEKVIEEFEMERQKDLKKLKSRCRAVAEKIQSIRTLLDEGESEYSENLTEMKALDKKFVDYDRAMNAYNGKKNAVKDLGSTVKLAIEKVEEIKKRILATEERVRAVQSDDLPECDACGQTMGESAVTATVDALKQKISELTQLKSDLTKKAKEMLAEYKKKKAAFEKMVEPESIGFLNIQREELQEFITEYKNHLAKLSGYETNLRDLESQYDSIKEKKNPAVENLDKLKKDIAEWQTKEDAAEKKIAECRKHTELTESGVEVFGPKGVRSYILDNVTPMLNSRTSSYLSLLSDNNITAFWNTVQTNSKGEYVEKFSIDVQHVTGGQSYNGLSGGEKRKVKLACAMALQDLVSTRATKPIDFLIADEIDDALDEAGLERLMELLEAKAKERGTVMVISHNDLGDWITQHLTVVKEDGYSKIHE